MKTANKNKKNASLILFVTSVLLSHVVWAESDMQIQEKALKAREINQHQGMDHAMHEATNEAVSGFRGVFYGYLPCPEPGCSGLKMTLSLKPNSNYLLVYQPAKEFSREFYEKGKYTWDDKSRSLLLTPNKNADKRLFSIKDEATLIAINNNGTTMPGDQDDYTLRRSDIAKSRQVHIH